MRFTSYLLVESNMAELKELVDEVVDQFAEERQFNHDAILRVVRQRLERDPRYASNPEQLEAAVEVASNYLR